MVIGGRGGVTVWEWEVGSVGVEGTVVLFAEPSVILWRAFKFDRVGQPVRMKCLFGVGGAEGWGCGTEIRVGVMWRRCVGCELVSVSDIAHCRWPSTLCPAF